MAMARCRLYLSSTQRNCRDRNAVPPSLLASDKLVRSPNQLGHASITTTFDIYGHLMTQARSRRVTLGFFLELAPET